MIHVNDSSIGNTYIRWLFFVLQDFQFFDSMPFANIDFTTGRVYGMNN